MSKTIENSALDYVYNVTFARNDNDNWGVEVVGLFRDQQTAIKSIWDKIMANSNKYLNKEAKSKLDSFECPKSIADLDYWCQTYTNTDKWYYYCTNDICEESWPGWGWDISKKILQ